MKKKNNKEIAIFENFKIRRHYDEKEEKWYFSVVDIIRVLVQQPNYQTARKYWNKLKERLKKEGNESVSNCRQLKFEAADGKFYRTDATDVATILRLVQYNILRTLMKGMQYLQRSLLFQRKLLILNIGY
ncbi:hypothetical protein KJ678_01845 [Patescibacteria group bacterium]|nr:hypothetical protein [Patescibacteria group bacterium]